MASPQKQSKPASRWGFLQQAVASVESRLDTILADEEDLPKKSSGPNQTAKENAPLKRASTEISRSNSNSHPNDRLQARLAKAMANKAGSRPESPMSPSEPVSRTATPLQEPMEEQRSAIDQKSTVSVFQEASHLSESGGTVAVAAETADLDGKEGTLHNESQALVTPEFKLLERPKTQPPLNAATSGRTSIDSSQDQPCDDAAAPVEIEAHPDAMAAPNSVQDEINGYIERIDALQAKLIYLTKETSASARQLAASADSNAVEKKLSEKDERIAILMEEGQKLSKTEMKHLTTIKKLRAQINVSSKEHHETNVRAEKAEKRASSLEARAERAEAAMKKAEENLAASSKASLDFEAVLKERNALSTTVAEIKAQLARANTRAEQAERKAQSDSLEKEKKRVAELQDDLTSAKIERELSEEKLKREIRDLKASLEREKEHSRAMETEMLGEQAILESKLEAFRAQAEEASSNDQGDSQAKLLRQIETLQTQYSSASQNWQGIEGSLLTRIANLEKERDETAAREGEVRKQLRSASSKSKQSVRDMEEMDGRVREAEQAQLDASMEAQRATKKLQQLEEEVKQAKADLERQRLQSERDLVRRIEEEKAKWVAANMIPRQDSPGLPSRKGSGFDMGHLMSPVLFERPHSRRSSTLHGIDSNTPPRQASHASFRALTNGKIPETPSIITSMDEEYFAGVPQTPASASQTHTASNRGVNDIISTSTVGAGPSVQLVERMSANVRRLESEKAASKDELARLATQRDEARQEVVNLMREVEQKRKVDERLKKLEEEHLALRKRYEATLEMAGEKAELVEELKADLADVKQMYRELVDTMK